MTKQEQRADRILTSARRLRHKLDNAPSNDPRRVGWETRMEQYEQSLQKLKNGEPEYVSATGVGVNVDVPAGLFNAKGTN